MSKRFKGWGALKVVECWGDDVPEGKVTSFPMAVTCKPDGRRSELQVHRRPLVVDRLRGSSRSRSSLGRAVRASGKRAVRLGQASFRSVLTGHPARAAEAARRPGSGQGEARDGRGDEDEEDRGCGFGKGRCEEALEFYSQPIGAGVGMLMRYGESPDPPPPGMIPSGSDNQVMHAGFQGRRVAFACI